MDLCKFTLLIEPSTESLYCNYRKFKKVFDFASAVYGTTLCADTFNGKGQNACIHQFSRPFQ